MLFLEPIEEIVPTGSVWTPERIDKLRELWPEPKMTASAIAAVLGGGITKNSVLGKAHRIGLPKKPQATQKASKKHYRPRKKTSPRLVREKAPPPPVAAPVASTPITDPQFLCLQVWELESHHCRFPIGNPGEEGFGFCGADCGAEQTYCGFHRGIVYVKHSTIKKSRAEQEKRIREMSAKGALKRWAA